MMSNKIMIGLGILLGIIIILSIFASSRPDGLEYVAEEEGFLNDAEEIWENSIFPDYEISGLKEIGTILSSIIGMLLVAIIFLIPALYLSKRSKGKATENNA